MEAVWHHEKFGKVLAAVARKGLLHEDMHGEMPPTAFLAHLVATVQQAMDVHLGRHAVVAKKRSMEKIPHHLFRDFGANGSLLVIIEETLKYMRDENIREVDQLQQLVFCQEDEDEFSHMSLLLQIREALLHSDFLVRPVLFFSSTLQRGKHGKERMEECQAWADALGAQVTDEQELATHFLIADTADMAETDEFFCRQVDQHHPQKKHTPDLAYVHWWFFPDSYDDWVPQLEVEGDYTHQERKSKWTVCLRWLRDSFKFNEWMNELDYEPDEDAPTAQGRFTAEEDATIWQAYKKVGKNYDEIRKCPGLGARSNNSIQGRLKILLKREEGGENPLAAPEREGSKKKRSSSIQDRARGPGEEGSARKGKHESNAGCGDGRRGAVRKPAVKVFRRVLTARHECWDDEVDLEASFAADPEIFCWDLPLCGEDDEDNSDSDQASQQTPNGGNLGDDGGGCDLGVSNAVLMKNIAGGALPLVLPSKASWFDSESVHDIEKAALPEYFDAKHERQGKTSQSYMWHRQAIISQWHLHVAAHIARLFRSSRQEDGEGKEAGSEGTLQGRKRHAKDLGASGNKRRRSEGCSQRQLSASAGAADGTDGNEEGEEGQDGDGEGFAFQWPPAMPVSVCLKAISGHSSDILRIFDFLESCAIINPPVDGEHETGGVWTERDLTQLCEAFRQHGAHWPAVAAQVGRADAAEECAVVMAGVVLRRSPLQRLASLHALRLLRAMPPAIGEAGDSDTTEKARAKSADILGLASVVHRGIGWQAAAAAVDAAIHHSLADKVKTRKASEAPKPEKLDKSDAAGSVTPMVGSEMQQLQADACKATILAKLSLRSSLLAQRETRDMRRVMVCSPHLCTPSLS